mgnify:CR=1 FL=1
MKEIIALVEGRADLFGVKNLEVPIDLLYNPHSLHMLNL